MGDLPRLFVHLAPALLQLVVRSGVVVSPLGVVTTCCSVFWVLVEDFLDQSRNGTGSFPV